MSWLSALFANPWMLAWLPAAAAPLLIHLWNRRKYREVSWAAMEYLLAAIVKSSRRMRIEQLLLLAVRTLLILLVVLALADPFVSSSVMPLRVGVRTHRLLVIDGSFSMAYQPADKTLFDLAKETAVRIVRDSNEGDAFTLILMSDSPQVVVGNAAYERSEFIEEIENVKLLHGGARVDRALQAAEEVVRQVRDAQDQLGRHHLYLLTDLGLNSWGQEGRDPQEIKALADRLQRLTRQGLVEIVPLGRPDGTNLAVESMRTTTPYATIAAPVTLEAVVRSFSDRPHNDLIVQWWVDGQRIAQQTIAVPAGGSSPPIVQQHRFSSPGDHRVEFRIVGDPLKVDNRRYQVVPVKEQLEVLLVSGKRRSTLPLEAALDDSDPQIGIRGSVRPHVVPESALLELDLNRYDCVFLCNVGQFTPGEAQVLHNYLAQGGGLVTFLGDQVQIDRYNRELAGERDGGPRVLPARLARQVHDNQYHFINPLQYRHPMLKKWRGNPKTGLVTVPIAKYIQLELPADSRATVVMGLDTGDPLIVEEAIGRGHSVLVATDGSTASVIDPANQRPWSLLASWLNSQPFFESLWQLAIGGRMHQRNVQVGESFGAPLPSTAAGDRIEITTPLGPQQRIPLAAELNIGRWSFGETMLSGFYEARVATGSDDALDFAVNVDTRESDLQKVHPEDLPDGFTVRADWQDTDDPQTLDLAPPNASLHRILLDIVVVLLLFEILLAWWIGHRSA